MNLKKSTLAASILSALMVTACGGSGGGNGGSSAPADNWAQSANDFDTTKIQTVKEVETKEGCDVKAGTLIVDDSNNNFSAYYLWAWTDKGNLIDDAEWPGEEFTQNVLSCTDTIHYYKPATSMNGYSVIVNDGTAQTGDGNVFTQEKPCLKITELNEKKATSSFVSATECGVTVDGAIQEIPNDVIIYNGDDVISGDNVIKIDEVAGVPESAYTTLTLTLRGLGLDENATGKYWFGDNADSAKPFKNGEKIIIGKEVKVEDGASKEIKLSVAYTLPQNSEASVAAATDAAVADVVKVYTIKKTFSLKNDECRLNKQEETLGATYTKESTTFRIWSPDTSDVKVTVDGQTYTLKKSTLACYTNVYEATVDGDLAGKTYQFTIGGKNARDPYGKMTAKGSNTANIVMDMSTTEPEDGWAKRPTLKNREDTIVYEVHVRDFTIDQTSGVDAEKRGRYRGMVQGGTTYEGVKTGIDHLKELGVTHVQLQPIFDYATCSNVDSQDSSCYNWGYDPWNYNVPEDRYTSVFGTDKYEQKIKEVKEMINEFHKQGIRVIMDVVYNHTMDKTVLGGITQNYYISKGDDITGCGNTVNADQNMVWTMIRDSMDYWVSEFHVDGFRLDLVGAFATKDYSDWGEYLNKQHPDANLVIYGEPWASENDIAEKLVKEPVRTGRMHKTSKDAHVGAFNNRIRNCLKGSNDDGEALGFIFNKLNTGGDGNGTDENDQALKTNKECVFMGVKAGVRHANATGTDIWSAQGFADPEQTVSYVTAHDNLALRDKIEAADITSGTAEAKALQVYANSIIMISQGISFIHGGEEFGRTKIEAGKNKHNTYNTTTGANDFKWDLKAGEWKSVNDSYAAYIHMRKAHPAFRMTTADQIFDNVTLDDASSDEVVIVNIDGESVGDSWEKIMVVMNSTLSEQTIAVPEGMVKVADGVTVGKVENNTTAAPQAVSIWAVVNEDAANKTHTQLYYVGDSSDWKFKPMTYKNGYWTLKTTLKKDSAFKFTGEASWDGDVYNSSNGTSLCLQGDEDCPTLGNITIEATGLGLVKVNDKTLEFSFEPTK